MKLLGDFFSVIETSVSAHQVTTLIELNPHHVVYVGHFPGHPVTPGVIQMQIVHELLEVHFTGKLTLMQMPQCKFLKVLDPHETTQLTIHIDWTLEDDHILVKARGYNEINIFFKLNALYKPKAPSLVNT